MAVSPTPLPSCYLFVVVVVICSWFVFVFVFVFEDAVCTGLVGCGVRGKAQVEAKGQQGRMKS